MVLPVFYRNPFVAAVFNQENRFFYFNFCFFLYLVARMRKTSIYLLVVSIMGFFLLSCSKDSENIIIDEETLHSHWMKLTIPSDGGGVAAVYGDVDDKLLIAIMGSIYITENQGQTWDKVYESSAGISGFGLYEGELMAFTSTIIQSGTPTIARMPSAFSTDGGLTWTGSRKFDYTVYDKQEAKIGYVELGDAVYQIGKLSVIEDDEGKKMSAQPDQILKITADEKKQLYFPSFRTMLNLHLDKQNRLYVGATGTRFEWKVEGNTRTYPNHVNEALLYISRKPVDKL